MISPPQRDDSHMQIRPLQQICKPSSKFRRQRALILQISLTPEINNKKNKPKHQRYIKISHLHLKQQIPLTKKFRSKATRSQYHPKKGKKNEHPVLAAVEATSVSARIKFLYKLYHLHMMKQRLPKKYRKTNTTPQCSSHDKDDLSNQQPQNNS